MHTPPSLRRALWRWTLAVLAALPSDVAAFCVAPDAIRLTTSSSFVLSRKVSFDLICPS